jgi:hypothetical protein
MTQGELRAMKTELWKQTEQDGECKHCTDGCPACDARKLPEQERFALKHRIAELEGAVIGLQAQRTWVGLTKEERHEISMANRPYCANIMAAHEEELKRRNT